MLSTASPLLTRSLNITLNLKAKQDTLDFVKIPSQDWLVDLRRKHSLLNNCPAARQEIVQ